MTDTATHQAATTAVLPDGTWTIDPAHTTIEFAVRHLGFATVKGRVLAFSGALVGGEHPGGELVMQADSLTTFEPDRDRHLRTPDFFDVAHHPQLRFVVSDVRRADEGIVLAGELTIRGITRFVELRGEITDVGVVDPWGGTRLGIDAELVIDRRDFNVSWNEVLPGGNLVAANEVRLYVSLSAVRED